MEKSLGYEIGYFIGSYLPVLLILGLALILWISAKKKQKKREQE